MAHSIRKLVAACEMVALVVLMAAMAVNAQTEWICEEGQNKAGWDVFPVSKPRYWIRESLTDCQSSCYVSMARCEFIVYNRNNGQCWPKTHWGTGGHGFNGPAPGMVACRMHQADKNRKLLKMDSNAAQPTHKR